MKKRDYRFRDLEVGDSVFISEAEVSGNLQRVRTAAGMYTKRTGRRLACRLVEGGIQVWRVEDDDQ